MEKPQQAAFSLPQLIQYLMLEMRLWGGWFEEGGYT